MNYKQRRLHTEAKRLRRLIRQNHKTAKLADTVEKLREDLQRSWDDLSSCCASRVEPSTTPR